MLADADYYARLPIFDGFASVMDPARYQPLPDDWVLGLTDVVSSTKAIEEGRYKAVNTAGASVIAAISNALGGRKFPFVFGGDGASFAVSGEDTALARAALAATAAWTRDDLQLELRVALVPVSAVREQGLNVSVARFAPSKNVSYAMFSAGSARHASRPKRLVLPMERHSGLARADPVAGGGAGNQWRSRVSQAGRRAPGRAREQHRSCATGAGQRSRRRLAAAGIGSRGTRIAEKRRASFHAAAAGERGHAARLHHHALRHSRRRFRSDRLPARGGREFGLPQVRRQPAHDPRLHARARRQDRAAPHQGGSRQGRAVWPAPPAIGDHDLHRAVNLGKHARPLRRRCGRWICVGRETAQAQLGLIREGPCRSGRVLSTKDVNASALWTVKPFSCMKGTCLRIRGRRASRSR